MSLHSPANLLYRNLKNFPNVLQIQVSKTKNLQFDFNNFPKSIEKPLALCYNTYIRKVIILAKAYEGNEKYIFFSYAHRDSATVLPMIEYMQEKGFRIWYDAGIEAEIGRAHV